MNGLLRRQQLRLLATATMLSVTVSLTVAGTASAEPSPTPTPTKTAAPADPTTQAQTLAKAHGKRIEVESLRSETTTIYANPDGKTLYAEVHANPIRVKKNGEWKSLDLTFVEQDGSIGPKAAKGDLALSPGGSADLLSFTTDKGTLTLDAPGKLSKPVLKDNTLTYPSAYGPQADLVITATPTGYRHEVVIRQRPAKGMELRIPAALPKGLKLGTGEAGRPAVLTDKGKQVAAIPPAVVVDAAAQANPDAGKITTAPVTVDESDGSTGTVVAVVDRAFLDDPAVTYPVSVVTATDTWTGTGIAGDTHVSNVLPNGAANDTLQWLLAGRSHSGERTHHTYIYFHIKGTPLEGGTVENADLRLWNYNSHTCSDTDSPGIVVHRVTSDWNTSTITWDNQPSTTIAGQVGNKGAYSSQIPCPEGEGELYHSIEEMTQAWMDGSAPDYGVRLSSAASDSLQNWRYYRSYEYGGYDTYPFTPRGPVLFIEYTPPVTNYLSMWMGSSQPLGYMPSYEEAVANQITGYASIPNLPGRTADEVNAASGSDDPYDVEREVLQPLPGEDPDVEAEVPWPTTSPTPTPEPDSTPPTVKSATPTANATGVPVDARVSAEFTEAVTGAQLTLTDPSGTTIPGDQALDPDNGVIAFSPHQSLQGNTVYTATVHGAKDYADNPMTAAYSWSFTTGGPDTDAPTVTGIEPGRDAANVAASTVVKVTFNEAVSEVQVTVKDPLDAAVQGTLAGDNGNADWTFTPASPLAAQKAYRVEVSGAKGSSGNVMAPYTWSFTTAADTPQPIPGLVAAYGMNEGSGTSVDDASGNNNTGSATATSWQNGKYGKALSFNGSSSWVTVQDAASLRLRAGMTLSAWVNPTTVAGWRSVVGKELQADGASYLLYASNGTVPTTWAQTDPENQTVANGSSPLPINAWSHLAATYDGAVLRLFVNGQQAAETALSGDLFDDGSPLRIGGNAIWGEFFSGIIDEVRVYNRAQSTAEIQADMNTPVGSGTPNPDTTPPTVSAVTPASQATSVPVTTSATATFSEAVTDAQFTLKDPAGAPVAGTTIMDATGRVLTFTPDQPLADTTTYTAQVAGAKDVAGNPMAGPYTWSFTTGTKPPTGLVAAYGMNEATGTTVGDASGNNNTGAARDTTWTTGKHGTALSFNGTSSWVTIEHAASLRLTNKLTLSAWVRPSALGNLWRTVLMKEHAEGGVYGLYASSEYTAPVGWARTTSAGGGVTTESPLPLDQWSHLATTYDGATFSLYVNGTQVAEVLLTGDVLDDGGELRIGGNAFWDEFYTGLIDEVRVYNRVQSAAEIQTDMNTPIGAAASSTAQRLVTGAAGIEKLTVNDSSTTDGVAVLSTLTPHLTTWLSAGRDGETKVEVEIARTPAKSGKFAKTDKAAKSKYLIWSGQATARPGDSRVSLQVPKGQLRGGEKGRWRARIVGGGTWTGWQSLAIQEQASGEGTPQAAAPLAATAQFPYGYPDLQSGHPTVEWCENEQFRIVSNRPMGAVGYVRPYFYCYSQWLVLPVFKETVDRNGKKTRTGVGAFQFSATTVMHTYVGDGAGVNAIPDHYGTPAGGTRPRNMKAWIKVNQPFWIDTDGNAMTTPPQTSIKAFIKAAPEPGHTAAECQEVNPVSEALRTRSMASWNSDPYEEFIFHSGGGTDNDNVATCSLRPWIEVSSALAAIPIDTVPLFQPEILPDVFCDTSPAIVRYKGGCRLKHARMIYQMKRTDPLIGQVAVHAWQAYYQPEITRPYADNKIVPGNADFLPGRLQEPTNPRAKPLHRAARYKNLPPGWLDVPTKNGNRKDTLCINEWTAAERSGKQCDEYPPATTHEGAAFAGTNVSVKPVDRLHNRDAGNDLNFFFERFRILDGDKFWVRIK